MSRYVVPGAVVSLTVLASVSACGWFQKRAELPHYDPSLYAAAPTPAVTASPAPFAWAGDSEFAIMIRKRERTLTVYRWQHEEKVYPIVLGIAPHGPKTYRGDLRTPEGVYRIVFKRPHERWSRFMLLSYPNDGDRQRYAMALSEGRVPIVDGHAPGLGNAVGIHGTDREAENVRGVDWTWGCISMFNPHVEELYDQVPLGTPVMIEE